MAVLNKKSYSKKPAKLPSKAALQEVSEQAGKPGSTGYYGKATPVGKGGLDAPGIEDFAGTPGTGLPSKLGL
jgi:hypothetical protein